MAGKKSIINLLPIVASDKDSTDFPCRFNRHVTGDYLGTEQQRNTKEKQDLCQKLENAEKPKQLVPPAGIPPLTAEELMKLKKSQPGSVVDYCKPVQYQFLPVDAN